MMLANWSAKSIAVMGATSGAGGVAFGFGKSRGTKKGDPKVIESVPGTPEKDYVDTWDGRVPTVKKEGQPSAWVDTTDPRNRTLRIAGMITELEGRKVLRWTANEATLSMRSSLVLMKPSWRHWAGVMACRRVMVWELEKAYVQLREACLEKRKRKGWQQVSTTHGARLPRFNLGTFGGRPAWRGPLGRPALPEQVWLNNYRSRLAKRRKKNKTKFTKDRGPVKVPGTVNQRPPFIMPLAE